MLSPSNLCHNKKTMNKEEIDCPKENSNRIRNKKKERRV